MRLLWIATKPPWPTIDGGRLVQALTLEALRDLGCSIEVVAPDLGPRVDTPPGIELTRVPVARHSFFAVLARRLRGAPVTLARHRHQAVATAAARLAASSDVVHLEQLQALAQAPRSRPLILRAQNAEHQLWSAAAEASWGPRRALLRREAATLRTAEGLAMEAVDRVVTLTEADRSTLASIAPRATIEAIAPPFPASLAPGPRLPGDPAFSLLVGRGWTPNRDGARWFVEAVWPGIVERRPGARLHLFGSSLEGVGIVPHTAPVEASTAFPAGSICVVPLRVAAGLRMKILESWARGLPVLATVTAAGDLAGPAVATGRDAADLVRRALELARDPTVRATLVAAGTERLVANHQPRAIASRLLELYADAASRPVDEPVAPRP